MNTKLLYGLPASVIGIYGIGSFLSAMDFSNPYVNFWDHVGMITFPLVLISLSGMYMFYAFRQSYINKYIKWSIISWYVIIPATILIGTILAIVTQTKGESAAFAVLFIGGFSLGLTILSVICAHVIGFKEIKPKSLNVVFIISILITSLSIIEKISF